MVRKSTQKVSSSMRPMRGGVAARQRLSSESGRRPAAHQPADSRVNSGYAPPPTTARIGLISSASRTTAEQSASPASARSRTDPGVSLSMATAGIRSAAAAGFA
jgi:hypothetical protein